MGANTWVKSNVQYGRKLVESGLAGVSSGREEFLQGEPFRQYLNASARKALKFSTAAACIGVATALLSRGRRTRYVHSVASAVACAAVGFAGGITWEIRQFLGSVTRRAVEGVNATRDEHWLDTHPIDYA
jgi:hypothetical protein